MSEICRHQNDPGVALQSLEKIVSLEVRISVVSGADIGTAREQCIALVEKKDDVQILCATENAAEILLRLADVLVDDGREIHAIKVQTELGSKRACSQSLAGSAGAFKQR